MKIGRAALGLLGLAILAGCTTVGAQFATSVQQLSWTLDTKDVPSGRYLLDPDHTSVLFKIGHLGYSLYVGRFNSVRATLDYDRDKPGQSELLVTIDPNSIDTGNDKLEATLTGKGYFDVSDNPQAMYAAKSIMIVDERHGVLNGELTLLGVTKPVPLDVVFNGGARNSLTGKYTIGFTATGSLKRSDFGMKTLIPLVSDEVYLEINVEFEREQAG